MRTGIAVIAFGFVVAQFNVFVARDARAAALGNSEQRHEFAHLFGRPATGGLRSLSARSCCPSGHMGARRSWEALSGERTRPLSPIFAECYGDITPGDRGGLICKGTRLRAAIRLIPIPADSHRHCSRCFHPEHTLLRVPTDLLHWQTPAARQEILVCSPIVYDAILTGPDVLLTCS